MSTDKFPGSAAIPIEIYKEGSATTVTQLTNLYKSMWHKEQPFQEFRDATIVQFYKLKLNRLSYDNH